MGTEHQPETATTPRTGSPTTSRTAAGAGLKGQSYSRGRKMLSPSGRVDPHGYSKYSLRLWDFEQGKDALRPAHTRALDSVITRVKRDSGRSSLMPVIKVVRGYSSPEGPSEDNEILSYDRALNAWLHLIEDEKRFEAGQSVAQPGRTIEERGETTRFGPTPYPNRAVEVLIEAPAPAPKRKNGAAPTPTPPKPAEAPDLSDVDLSDANTLGRPTSDVVAGATDVVSAVDLGLQVAELGGASVGAATTVSGALAGVGLAVFSVLDLVKANESGEIAESCVGAAYAYMYWAHGLSAQPKLQPDHSNAASFRAGYGAVMKRLQAQESDPKYVALRAQLKSLEPRAAVNELYQMLIQGKLEDTFLFVFPVGGVKYELQKTRRLAWPQPLHVPSW